MDKQNKKELMKGFITAANLLPDRLWHLLFSLPVDHQLRSEEFRLRIGKPLEITADGKPVRISGTEAEISREDIENVLARATRCSLHTYENNISNGFITAEGGHRIGICGSVAMASDGRLRIAEYTSLNIRVSRQHIGIGQNLADRLVNSQDNILILAAPGTGKTTLLRDLCRIMSSRMRISIADCRFEIAGTSAGRPIFDLGFSDIMQGGSMKRSISMLLRTMSPEMIAVDEITSSEDIEAMYEASHTGCRLMATAHGASISDLKARPLYRQLDESGIFETIVLLSRIENLRMCRIYERSRNDKDNWVSDDNFIVLGNGNIYE